MHKDSDLMVTERAAEYLDVSKGTLPVWRCRGTGPKYVRIGRCIKYRKADLDAYIEERTVETANAT